MIMIIRRPVLEKIFFNKFILLWRRGRNTDLPNICEDREHNTRLKADKRIRNNNLDTNAANVSLTLGDYLHNKTKGLPLLVHSNNVFSANTFGNICICIIHNHKIPWV